MAGLLNLCYIKDECQFSLLPLTYSFIKMDIDPYSVLGVEKDASDELIRRAYRKKALQHHPDRIHDEEKKVEARIEFDKVAIAYGVLSDKKRRKHYDKTGQLRETDADIDFDWKEWLDELYQGVVSGETLNEFKASYQYSEEEKCDVLKAYEKGKGSMDVILEEVMCCEISDEDRFRQVINNAIKDGKISKYKRFAPNEKKRKRRAKAAEREAQEAEELSMELGLDENLKKRRKAGASDEEALSALIRSRQKSRMYNLISNLESKYSKSSTKPKKSKKSRSKE
nr:putative DNAJC9 family protein [Schizosaccharomyces pombe]Q9UTQ5.1 RecName: Full=Uncharacterized J domain-containing protein C1071.09c [Schizosaccharomyces pombe 972h-]CAB59885.1 DNAJ domain protein, DNAJC9 family (predicted) [Schizosaccharomyces pombe]|eukprot:NP_594359.1 putative DNAJC9 family protein [Schizosaccharomyces pombe]